MAAIPRENHEPHENYSAYGISYRYSRVSMGISPPLLPLEHFISYAYHGADIHAVKGKYNVSISMFRFPSPL